MRTFVLIHKHNPAECAIAYAAWSGFDSPLRGRTVQSTCARHQTHQTPAAAVHPSTHEIFWTANAEDATAALAQLPPYVRERTQAREVTEVTIR